MRPRSRATSPPPRASTLRKKVERGEKLTPTELVRLRVGYFSEARVLGSKRFVEGVFHDQRSKFGPTRKEGAKAVPESEAVLYSIRRVRKRALE